MAFSNKQVQALKRDVKACFVRTRQNGDGRELSYIEGWHAIGEANRIFGHDGWSRETVETKCVLARESKGTFHAVYLAKVRVTVKADGENVVREGCGTGEAMGASAGEVHEKALKTAETDATKRALATFGKPFGLSLYVSGRNGRDQQRPSTSDQPIKPIPNHERRRTRQVLSSSGRYYVPPRPKTVLDRELSAIREAPSGQDNTLPEEPQEQTGSGAPADQPKSAHLESPPTNPPSPNTPMRTAQDLVFPLAHPKRHREPTHLKAVMQEPCLLCGRTPSDAHHLRFAQPRALGRKVSDEFTVPLCRTHHRQLHQSGNEVAWWLDMGIDPLPIAQDLWAEFRKKEAQIAK